MKSFAARAFRVAFDECGLRSAAARREPDPPALMGLDIGPLCRDGVPLDGGFEPAVIDADEVEQRWSAPGVATIEIRHSFLAGWRTRLVVAELSGRPWRATLRLALRPGPGHRPWRLAIGTGGALALLPEAGETALLAVRSGPGGAPIGMAADGGLEIGPYALRAGERLVSSWEWSSPRYPYELGTGLRSVWPALPRRSTVAVEEDVLLPADPDAALVTPPGVATETVDDRVAAYAVEAGRHRVELRSARGSTVLDLAWAPPVGEFLTAAALTALAAPAGRSGVVPLPDVATALVVQRVARTAGFPAIVEADDALDQFTARLDPGPTSDRVLAALYLAGEYDRLGDPDLIARANLAVPASGPVVRGLGLAAVRTTLASVLAGGATSPAVRFRPVERPDTTPELELLLATRSPEALVADDQVTRSVHRVAVRLGAGLPGRLADDQDLAETAYLLAVLRLLPESFGRWWHRRFGGSVGELVEERSLELVDRLRPRDGEPAAASVSAAHAWLALGF